MNAQQNHEGVVDWGGIAIFAAVAAGWSALAAHVPALALPARVGGLRIDNSLLVGAGPLLGGLVASALRGGPGPGALFASLLGPSRWLIVAALLAPVATAALFGLPGAGSGLPGLLFAASVVLYCVGEELGWRGWLQQALAGLQPVRAALLTALLWYGWHWTFLAPTLSDPRQGIGFAIGLLLGSFGLAASVRRTGATGMAVAWHAAVKLLGGPLQITVMLAALVFANWRAVAPSPPPRQDA